MCRSSAGSEEDVLPSRHSATSPPPRSSGTTTAERTSLVTGLMSLVGAMFTTSLAPSSCGPVETGPRSSSEAGSPASRSVSPAGARRRTTTGGSGPRLLASQMSYDPGSSSWRTSEGCFPPAIPSGRRSRRSSERWPTWGSIRGGELFELPTPERATSEPGSSSLPTPRTRDTNGPGVHGTGGLDLRTAVTLLPTPTASSYGSNRGGAAGRVGKVRYSLDSMARQGLLPTPTARDFGRLSNPSPSAPTNALLGRLIPRLGVSTSQPSASGSA